MPCRDHERLWFGCHISGEADLIRNFLLMRVHVGDQQRVFNEYWLPIQQALGDYLTEFVRHYLMKEGKILTAAHVYFELKDRLVNTGPKEVKAFLADLHRHGTFYARLINPTREHDRPIASALDRLRRLESTVTYPLLLRVFDSADRGALSREQVLELLTVLESFLVRRSICGVPTNQLRAMLPPVFDAAGGAGSDLIERVKTQLGGKRCPDDVTFTVALHGQPLYSTSKKNLRLRLILERLEQSHGHKEPADLTTAQIEHVMPQTLTPEWTSELGDDAQNLWARLLHTLGNLTLTGYNADLSNRPYHEKRVEYGMSHFDLNRAFKDVERWTPSAIEARGRDLAKRALDIWPDLARPNTMEPAVRRMTPPPVAVRFRAKTEPVTTWKKAAIKLIEEFEAASPGLLASVEKKNDLDARLSRDPDRFSRSNACIGDIYVQMHGSASTLRSYVDTLADRGGFARDQYEFILPTS